MIYSWPLPGFPAYNCVTILKTDWEPPLFLLGQVWIVYFHEKKKKQWPPSIHLTNIYRVAAMCQALCEVAVTKRWLIQSQWPSDWLLPSRACLPLKDQGSWDPIFHLLPLLLHTPEDLVNFQSDLQRADNGPCVTNCSFGNVPSGPGHPWAKAPCAWKFKPWTVVSFPVVSAFKPETICTSMTSSFESLFDFKT